MASPKPAIDPFWLWSDTVAQAKRLIDTSMRPSLADNPVDALYALNTLVSLIEFLTEQDTDVGIFELMQVDMSNYVVAHHVQTVFLCGLIANKLGLPEARRRSLCRAAFTMNIAVLKLQDVLSRQHSPITEAQQHAMQGHGLQSRRLLEKLGVTDSEWLRAVEEHHPESLPDGQRPGDLAVIIHHADIYLAKISPRAYRPAKTADTAARELLTSASVDRRIVGLLIKEFGIYPPGSFVALANGDTAIVVRRSDKAHAPHVFSIARNGQAFPRPVPRDTGSANFAISGIAARSALANVPIDRAALLGY